MGLFYCDNCGTEYTSRSNDELQPYLCKGCWADIQELKNKFKTVDDVDDLDEPYQKPFYIDTTPDTSNKHISDWFNRWPEAEKKNPYAHDVCLPRAIEVFMAGYPSNITGLTDALAHITKKFNLDATSESAAGLLRSFAVEAKTSVQPFVKEYAKRARTEKAIDFIIEEHLLQAMGAYRHRNMDKINKKNDKVTYYYQSHCRTFNGAFCLVADDKSYNPPETQTEDLPF